CASGFSIWLFYDVLDSW
nr:immunoglobulin heavy chain junction region [Macaca mulatta]MOX58613.1 immunoglobulin heavy chain junction region [Macaca mulatta]MOX58759.1 immunoglobulin heavy chain junction region [Macaca mulatta]MOX58799.1 immunoglobulin heavy chain junction region [Macaca mulatta]MOX59179.1 immunoglobulin heavy chain junction region [Macaca mulatta]